LNEAGYKFIKTAPNEYEFYTVFGAAYKVSFDAASMYFKTEHPVKDFIFSADIQLLYPGLYNHYDYVIGITIAEIFFHFFESDKRNIIFYICDPSDGKMAARNRKFDFWFRNFGNSNFKKLIVEINMKEIAVQADFIFEKNNVFAYDLPIIIDEAKDNLSK
jgi:hypothetical protein